jgi:hypothetical protein
LRGLSVDNEWEIKTETMEIAKGAWAGVRPNWWTITHVPTGFQLKVNDYGSRLSQHKMRDECLSLMKMLIDEIEPVEGVK